MMCGLNYLKYLYKTVALDEQFKINPWILTKENGGIIFPNPNAPTAIEMPLEQVEEVIKIIRMLLLLWTKHMLISKSYSIVIN